MDADLVEKRQNQLVQTLQVSQTMAFFIASCFMGAAQDKFEAMLPFIQVFKAQPSPPEVLQSPFLEARQCYRNAAMLCELNDWPQYRYCEGWAFKPHLIPLSHAWVKSEQGIALDPTWELFFDQEQVSNNEYAGFVFKPWTLLDLLDESGVYGVFETPQSARKVFLEPEKYLERVNWKVSS